MIDCAVLSKRSRLFPASASRLDVHAIHAKRERSGRFPFLLLSFLFTSLLPAALLPPDGTDSPSKTTTGRRQTAENVSRRATISLLPPNSSSLSRSLAMHILLPPTYNTRASNRPSRRTRAAARPNQSIFLIVLKTREQIRD